MDITLAIIILVAIMYFIISIGAIIFILNKRKNIFKQTIDPKPTQSIKQKTGEYNQ